MRYLIALLLMTSPASAQVWTEWCGHHSLTASADGVFVLEENGKVKLTCRAEHPRGEAAAYLLAPIPTTGSVLSCDNGEAVTMTDIGNGFIEFNGVTLADYDRPAVLQCN